ncbi:nucleotide exchange factor GrpE [Gleimia hominis]|uniref:Protein GrpE n=1 Tax=Gleimia hominis TaxID=595468 RepID=A0ABU3I9F5_9ACTO|nr:nucleotide exchange factor GrpE [Gleimia hominis]MDT3767006.1 nucleotide exchange factor GrpE [Gleimia hominis]
MSNEELNHDPENQDREEVTRDQGVNPESAQTDGEVGGTSEESPRPTPSEPAGTPAGDNPETGAQPQEETDGTEETLDPEDISHLEEQLADVDTSADANELDAAREQMAQLGDDLARARADHYNLQQQHNNYVRRSKQDISDARKLGHGEVVEALMPVLDDIDAARTAGALEEGTPFTAIVTKLETTLQNRYELTRFGEEGEEFDPAHHEAVMAVPTEGVEHPTIQQVVQKGYRVGERVLRPAKVIVANPQ